MVISDNYDAASIDDFYIEGSAYVDFTDEVTITTDNLITVKKTDFTDDHYQYFNSINMTFDKENDQYSYGAIIKVNVEGEDYYFVVNLEDGFSFYSSIALSDKDQAEFEVVKVIKTEYSSYRQSKSNPGPMIVFLVAIPFIVAFMLAGLPIFIVLMVNAARKRKRK